MSLVTIVPTAARIIDGVADFNGWTPDLPVGIQLDVIAVSGISPTLGLYFEQSYDGTTWHSPWGALLNIASVGAIRWVAEVTPGATGQYRVRWAIGGTSPSFTFSVIAHAKP